MRRPCIFWNVQRLFDPAGLPVARSMGAVGERWTRSHYRRKIANLAACLRAATGGRPPALLGLAEVESVCVQQDLRRALGWPDLIITDELVSEPDLDGLDVALMLDGALFDVDTLRARSFSLDDRLCTRELLEVRVRPFGSKADAVILVAHWPSRRVADADSRRALCSEQLRRLAGPLVPGHQAPEEPVRGSVPCVVMGDFDDEPHDHAIDRVSFSAGALVEGAALRYVSGSARAVCLPVLDDGAVAMLADDGAPRPFTADDLRGASDHLPLYFELDVRGA